jgi:uncharacterized membrane protein YdjX (TVP38/TMEM64 family)
MLFLKRILVPVLFLLLILLGYWQKEAFLEAIQSGGVWSFWASIVFVSLLVFFPIVPFIFVAGVIGVAFGFWAGSLISLIGVMIGTLLMFVLTRLGFRDWVQRNMERYPKAQEYERVFEKNAFAAILFFRIVPVIPAPAVNVLSSLSKVSIGIFALASLLGKLPSVLIFTYAGSHLRENSIISIITYAVYFLAIVIAAAVYQYRRKEAVQE